LVLLPESVVFIAGVAFPRSCEARIVNIDPCQELTQWNEGRWSGSSEAFERHLSGQPYAGKRSENELWQIWIWLIASRLNVWREALAVMGIMTGWYIKAWNVISFG
jgi:hypothetical protein